MLGSVFASGPDFLLACLVLISAELIYVMFGFGSGLIAVGLMALFMDVVDIVVLVLFVNVPIELWVVRRSSKKIDWRGVLPICGGLVAGVLAGTYLLKEAEPTFVLFVLGCFLVAAGSAFLFVPHGARVRWPFWTGPPVGLGAGVLAGLFGTGGPPVILYYQLAGVEKAVFRGNLMVIFLTASLLRFPMYGVSGLITEARLISAAMLLPAAIFGAWLGNRFHVQLSELRFRQMVSVALCVLGILLLLK